MSGLSLIDVWYRRLPRYLFIEDRLRDQPVLELGCGSGLGADFLIEQGAGRVVGVDADERQILKARARYKRPNLSFEVAQGADLPFEDGEFGLVLIPEGSQAVGDAELLAAVRRVLRPDGLCLLAAPNGDLEEPDPDGLSYYDMIESLEPLFPSVTMVAQTPMFGFTFVDFLASAEDLDVGLDDSLAQDLVDEVAYYVALCSAEPYSPDVFAITQVPFAPIARRVQHLLDGQPPEQLELGELQEALAAEREERIRLDGAAADLEQDLVETQNIMRDLRSRLAEADELQTTAEGRVAPLQAELADVTRSADGLRAAAEELERERDGLREQAERYAQRAEGAEEGLAAARQAAGELEQQAQSQSAALSEMETLRASAQQGEQDQAELKARLAEEQARVEGLAAERNEAAAALETAERELTSLRGAEEQTRQRAEELAQKLDEVGQELEQRGQRVTELERELDGVRSAADQGGHRIVELERELGEVRDQAEESAHQIGELQRELGEARGGADQLGERLGELERELSETHDTVDGKSQRVGELERELGEIRGAADQGGQRIGELERELDEARGDVRLREQRSDELERELDEAREEAAQRKQRTGELKRQVDLAGARGEGLGERIGELERGLDSARDEAARERDQAATRIEQLREQIAEAEVALGGAQQQCSGLEERLVAEQESADVRAVGLREELDQAQQEVQQGVRQRDEAQAEAQRSLEQIEALENGLDASRDEVGTLKTAVDQAQHATADREGELSGALERVSGLSEQLAEASERATTVSTDLERVGQQLLAVDEQRASQGSQVRELELELATAQADRRSLEVRLEQALIRADESEVTGAEFRSRKKDLESRLIAELEEAREASIGLRSELEARQSELEARQSELKKEQSQAEEQQSKLEKQQSKLEKQRSQAEEQKSELEKQRSQAAEQQSELEELRSQAEEQRSELEEAQSALTQSRSELEQQRSQAAEQQSELEEAQSASTRSGEELVGVQAALKDAQSSARDHQTATADTSVRLEASLRDAEARASSAELRAQGLEVRIAEQENETYGLQDLLRSTADATGAREAALEAVQAQLAAEQGNRSERDEELEEAAVARVALERTLQEERQVREEIERSLGAVESSMAELSSAGEQAVQELEATREQAAEAAAEAARWQQQCTETQRELQQSQEQVAEQAAIVERAPNAADVDETVGQLRSELESVRAQGAALGAERARLLRQANVAEDGRDAVAERLSSAERAHEATAQGMEMVIARLESERERAEGLDSEIRELRERVEERGEFTVKVTREAGIEAQRARKYRRELDEATAQAKTLRSQLDRRTAELQVAHEGLATAAAEPATGDPQSGVELTAVIHRLEERTTALQAAQATIGALSDELGMAAAEQQELRRANAAAAQADDGVSDWDAEIEQGKLRALEAEQTKVQAELVGREQACQDLEGRLQHQADHVRELLSGAEQHRLEMADREIALAEQAAWNAELAAAGDQSSQELSVVREGLERGEARLAAAQTEVKELAGQIARLEGLAKRRDAELEELKEASAVAADNADVERAMETAIQEAAAFKQRLEDTKADLFEREDRIEELEALLELAKVARGRAMESAKKRETLIGIGPETVEIPPYRPETAPQGPTVDVEALRAALDEVSQLEKTCQMEEERISVLATSLARLGAQAKGLQEKLVVERLKMDDIVAEREELAQQASRLPELELELDLLRSQPPAIAAADPQGRVEVAEQLLLEQKTRAEELAQRSEVRITELNNTIGDKDAEILLLHASMESVQRRAGKLAANIQEAIGGATAPTSDSAQALLDRVKSELEGMKR